MKYPLVSILTTVYNREKYLADCIESVLDSTYQDWELILVDDQSTDASVAIAERFAAKDQRIHVYVNEQNLGDYPNRNQAAAYAKGKYLKYLDADDLLYPHGLQIMVETMEAHPQCALGISQEVAEDIEPFPFVLTPYEAYYREFLKRGVLGMPPTNTIIKRNVFEELGRFSAEQYIGDIEFWLRLAKRHNIVKMVPGLVYWRKHDEQEYEKGMQTNSYLINNYKMTKSMLLAHDCPLTEMEKEQATRKYDRRLSRNLIRFFLKNRSLRQLNQLRKQCGVGWAILLKL